MDKTQQDAQLRLAADIIETGHPWHLYRSGLLYDTTPVFTPISYLDRNGPRGYEIRLVLATPPDGRSLHNPDNLTAEQVGAGWRLTLKGEKPHEKAEMRFSNGNKWCGLTGRFSRYSNRCTYRVPLSTPWPEAPDPYAELKKALAEGKAIEVYHMEGLHESQQFWKDCPNPDWMPHRDYRIKPDSLFQAPPPPPNMRWHSQESWNEYDTPSGYRLLVEGETIQHGDEFYEKGWRKASEDLIFGVGKTIKPIATAFRTTRPLTFTHEGKTWTWHRPGDPMPCDGESMVHIITRDNDFSEEPSKSKDYEWDQIEGSCRFAEIIGWRYSDEKKTVPLGPEDIHPFTRFRVATTFKPNHTLWIAPLCANQNGIVIASLHQVVEVSYETLQKDYERNESLVTGKWNPDAWEPCSKPA